MAQINFGRVRGFGTCFTILDSSDQIQLAAITNPNDVPPIIGDAVQFSNGDVRRIIDIVDTIAYLTDVLYNLKGDKGDKGESGSSVSHAWDGTKLIITSESGTTSSDLKGEKGADGYSPVKGKDYFDGVDGKDGYSPVKGKDYFDGVDGKDGENGTTFTPRVDGNCNLSWSNNGNLSNPATVNIKGDKGNKGDKGDIGAAAGFGTPTASIDNNVGTPGVIVTASGLDTNKIFNFKFTNLKGEKGDKGRKGDKGDPFTIAKTFDSIATMNSGFDTDGIAEGSFVVIDTGNIEDEDNAKLYVKGLTSYTYIADLSGMPGLKGEPGESAGFGVPVASIDNNVGTPGVTITASGPDTDKIFNFKFTNLKGDKGEKGDKGDAGNNGYTPVKGVDYFDGEKGADGLTPTLSINEHGELIAVFNTD